MEVHLITRARAAGLSRTTEERRLEITVGTKLKLCIYLHKGGGSRSSLVQLSARLLPPAPRSARNNSFSFGRVIIMRGIIACGGRSLGTGPAGSRLGFELEASRGKFTDLPRFIISEHPQKSYD